MWGSIFNQADTGGIARSETGSMVIETAVILPVFLLLVFSTLEFGLIMYVTALVDDAVTEGSRYGMTGSNYTQLQPQVAKCMKGNTDRTTFLQCFVEQRANLFCHSGSCVTVSATPYTSWPASGSSGSTGFNSGTGGQVVQYTVVYTWNTLSPMMWPFLGKKYKITASSIVQDEAFGGVAR